ncbi:MAG: hypothetical protein Q9183_005113, partial [Haloplaca sp. 2 TL-2023]
GNTGTDLKEKWNKYLKAIQAYLDDFNSNIETASDSTGSAIKDFAGDDNIAKYFAAFCKDKYKVGQDYVKDQLDKIDDGDEGTAQCLKAGSKQLTSMQSPLFVSADDR